MTNMQALIGERTQFRHLIVPFAFVALAITIVWLELRFWPFYIDDSYISLVYVKNWIAGNGLTFNGKVVEGYSNFLWVILLGLIGRTGIDLVLASRLLGMLCSLLILPVLAALGRQLCNNALVGWLAGLLLAVSGPFLAWSVGGLETMLYALLLLLTMHLVLKEQAAPTAPYSAVSAILLALTRPEGVGYAVAICGFLGLMALLRQTSWRYVVQWALIFALGFGAFLTWRYLYYHAWLPAPVLAKRSTLDVQLSAARTRLTPLLSAWWIVVVGSLLGFLLLFGLNTKRRSAVLLLALLALADAVFIVVAGDDWMPMYRFVAPLLPMIFLALAGGAFVLAERLAAWARMPVLRWIVPLLLIVAPGLQVGLWTEQNREKAIARGVDTSFSLELLAPPLMAEAPPGATLAVIDAGYLPYATGLPSLDLVGLNDQYIASTSLFGRQLDIDYVLAAKPTYVVLHYLLSDTGQPLFTDFLPSVRLYYHPEFQRWYDVAEHLPMQPFVRRSTPREQTIMDRFWQADVQTVQVEGATLGEKARIEVTLQNNGSGVYIGTSRLTSGAVFVACRLRDVSSGALVGEQWIALQRDLVPGEQRTLNTTLGMPTTPGDYQLEIDLVLQDVAWFSEQGNPIKRLPIQLSE